MIEECGSLCAPFDEARVGRQHFVRQPNFCIPMCSWIAAYGDIFCDFVARYYNSIYFHVVIVLGHAIDFGRTEHVYQLCGIPVYYGVYKNALF